MERPITYKFHKADWDKFTTLAELNFNMICTKGINEATENITKAILNAADFSIPKTSLKPPKYPKPWWNSDCKQTYKDQKKAWDTFRRYPTQVNLIAFKRARAIARKVRKHSQRECWEKYL